ncbi:MAG: Stk1 family PASTA domain-containing Ser/Thr kinase [Lachnospiraceae bacterium]|nr:Stk1 family PASTA domain-containing Ser/Thr kinase [Lachnospiraceae bacterium]
MLKNGTVLSDRYEILGKVGSGGMSDVYKAKCHKLNRYVAIKVLKAEYSEDKNFVSKFRAEAQAAAGLSHPNIVNIYDVGEDNGLYYIVMELVEGITLKTYIEKKGRLDVKEAVSIAIQVAQGIQTAHSHHIIHRDIKPQNIIISKEGKVKVTDFGIARASSAQTINSNAMGSVHYISPEQARGSYSDERSDIYSLGISLYEMITGSVPFEGDTTVAVALQHIQGEIPSPRDIVPNLPVSVEKIIYKCTQKKPERRYAKASELIVDLKRSLVTPNDDFVELTSNASAVAPTVSLTQEEVTILKNSNKPENKSVKKEYDRKFYEEEDDTEEHVNPKVERIMTVLTVVAAVLIVCLLIFIVVKMMPKPNGTNNPVNPTTTEAPTTTGAGEQSTTRNEVSGVPMPNVINISENDAMIALNQVNLGIGERTYENSNEIEKGKVIRAEYEAGKIIPRNTSVKLVISSGPEKFAMPDVTNRSEQEAAEILKSYNINYTTEYSYSDEIEQGKVVSTSPASGTMVAQEDIITLYLSQGPEFKDVVMPSLKGMTLEEAKLEIEKNALIVGEVTEDASAAGTSGTIVNQSVAEGETVKAGTKIDLTVVPERVALIGSVTISKQQVSSYISNDGKSFVRTNAPGPASANVERYAEAVMKLELVQVTEDGKTISRVVGNFTVTPESFPFTVSDIQGEPGLTEGSIVVTLSFGGNDYSCGSCLVDFQ